MAETIDKKGRKVTRADIEAQAKRLGLPVIYVVDEEIYSTLEKQQKILDGIWRCLSSMSGLNNYKEVK